MTPMATIFERDRGRRGRRRVWLELRDGLHDRLLEEVEYESVKEAKESYRCARWTPSTDPDDGEYAVAVALV